MHFAKFTLVSDKIVNFLFPLNYFFTRNLIKIFTGISTNSRFWLQEISYRVPFQKAFLEIHILKTIQLSFGER
jgi:uncharacterized membrane protein YfhO